MYNHGAFGSYGFGGFDPASQGLVIAPTTPSPKSGSDNDKRRKRRLRRQEFSVTFAIIGIRINKFIEVQEIVGIKSSKSIFKEIEISSTKRFIFSNTIELQGTKRNVFSEDFKIARKSSFTYIKFVDGGSFHGYHFEQLIQGTVKNRFTSPIILQGSIIAHFDLDRSILGIKISPFSEEKIIVGKRNRLPILKALQVMTVLDTLED